MSLERLTAALSDRYTIERELGAGGMATVYLAEDLKHRRKVAIKVLKPELAAVLGADRFVQEITTTAALQHPHILPLFDSGESDGFLWYAMPFIDGETLRAKLDRETQLSVDEAIKITTEVADALHYAHTQGVVHRDIKPENILLANGRPMVADFGIALALSAAAGGRMTETGMSLGTPHYMSPEQATADKEIGPRSDIYSLASVCYEMLTGEPPHMGGSAQAIIMKIIAETAAPVTKVRKSVPANVAAAVGKALEKLPADRFESAKAFAEALGNPAFAHHAAGTAATSRLAGPDSRRLVTALAASTAVLAAALAWVLLGRRVPEEPAVSVHAFLSDTTLPLMGAGPVAISPDGETVIVKRTLQGDLFARSMDDDRFRRIEGPTGVGGPRVSPDGQFLVFQRSASGMLPALAQMPLAGGPVVTLADSVFMAGWCDDGSLIVQRRGTTMRVAEAGAVPVAIMELDSIEVRRPSVLPDCSGLLFNEHMTGNSRGLLLDLRTGAVSEIATLATSPRYVATGHILYQSERPFPYLTALPFDLKQHRVTGPSVQVVPNVWDWDLARNGTLVYVETPGNSASAGVGESLAWVDMSGRATPLPIAVPDFETPKISPNGRQIAFEDFNARALLLYDISTGATTTISKSSLNGSWTWARDGGSIFVADGDGLRRIRTDGTGAVDTLHHGEVRVFAITPDQRHLVLGQQVEGRGWDIVLLRLDDPTPTIEPYLRANWDERQPALSPDGRWLAYVSDESGSQEVYVRSFPVPGDPVQISDSGGTAPAWAPDGTTIFYDGVNDVMRAELAISPAGPTVRSRRHLFSHDGFEVTTQGMFQGGNRMRRWDLAADGTRFLMVRSAEESFEGGARLRVITNFPDEIRRRMATP